jgi:hypothetical protein
MISRNTEGFNDLQLQRRKKTLEPLFKEADAFERRGGWSVDPHRVMMIEELLVKAYNAGYADSQNETRDSFKLE